MRLVVHADYQQTQKTMHIQGLKRSDILNGSVKRLQNTLLWNILTRWKEVVKQRKRQIKH